MNTLQAYLKLLFKKREFNKEEARILMDLILQEANPEQTAAFLAVLKYRGAKPQELAGMVEALDAQARHIHFPKPLIDIVGTGGDMASTVNISTGSAILAAACGLPVVKHGN